ncbi:MAG TPA: hypothetical protein VM865_02255 [Acidobacteriaceae bacterium]|nr:hypothetical protein [Acidobacteriaceae bacterium]
MGDDRQIFVTYLPDGHAQINDLPFAPEEIPAELAKIFQYRAFRFIWIRADPHLSYGELAANLSKILAKNPDLKLLLPTPSQLVKATMELCP